MSKTINPLIKLAAVVVLYNPSDSDLKNIETYLSSVDKLYIIDNTEGKSNKNRLMKSEKIEYITKNKNLGIAKALNLVAKKAKADGYSWLLTNDQDTKFPPKVIDSMLKEISSRDISKIAIVTPWHKTKLVDKKPKTKYDDPHDVMTSGNIVNLDILEKLGGFNEDFFIDCVDIEYCIRLHKNGYKILRINSLEIDHELGDLFYRKVRGILFLCTNHPPIRRYYMMRNAHYLLDMYRDYDPNYCVSLAAAQKHNMVGVALFEKHKIKKIRMYLKGYSDYKKGVKGKYAGR